MDAQPSPLTLSPGRYRLDERLPQSRRGRWRLDDVICDGQVLPNPEEAEVEITDGAGATCTFENSFVAAGEIEIDKVTLGGVTTTGFVIWPVADPETRYRKVATTEARRRARPGQGLRHRRPSAGRVRNPGARARLALRGETGRSWRWSATGAPFPPSRVASS